MAEQSRNEIEFFPDEWAARVKQIIFHEAQERIPTKDAPPMHVPKAVLSLNPEQYIPQFISLGPYHYHNPNLEDVPDVGLHYDELTKMSMKEEYKIKFAAILSQIIINYGKSMEVMLAMIEEMRPKIERFYNSGLPVTEGMYSKNFALMIMVDSLFLLYFFFGHEFYSENGVRIKCDILKLENQIPLFVLKQIFEKFELSRILCIEDSITELLQRACKELCPFHFYVLKPAISDDALTDPHLLGCIHAIVSPFLVIEVDTQYPSLLQRISIPLEHYLLENVCNILFCFTRRTRGELPIKAYTAGELAKAGIKFKSFSMRPHRAIRFDNYSETIYLPRMTVSFVLQTEVFFRNLLALEFVDAARQNTVTNFIQMMDCLIDTPDDVAVLMKSHVISHRSMQTEKDIADIWEAMRRPFFHGNVQPPKHLKEALEKALIPKYYKIKIRSNVSELFQYYSQQYFSKPWTVVALPFGTFTLAMNMVQAYCSLRTCTSGNSN